ncbi:MAG: ComEC/Rec2 family competence protein [Candidatus Sericytochromatia bacterium]|nr:ComEC/Rec2 family competence protein [Candidatus Sericytochromatia bacterium]
MTLLLITLIVLAGALSPAPGATVWAACLAVGLAGLILRLRHQWPTVAVCLLAVPLLPLMSAYTAWRAPAVDAQAWDEWFGKRVQLIGTVASAQGQPGHVSAVLTIEQGWRPQRLRTEGAIQVMWPALQPPPAGTRWLLDGDIMAPRGSLLPGMFDRADWLARKGVVAQMRVRHWAALAGEISWLEQVRLRLVPIFTQGTDGRIGPLAASLVFGVSSTPLDPELMQVFRRLNLTHYVAASGFQLTLLTGVCVVITQRWGRRTGILISVPILTVYIALTGAPASIIRAAAVTGLGLIGTWFDRPTHPTRALLVAACGLLLWSPGYAQDLGFAFSVLATWGLLSTAPGWERWLLGRWPRLPAWLAASLVTPLAAQLWVMPLQLHTFGQVSGLSLPANIISGFAVDLWTKVGFVAACLGLIWAPLALPLTWVLGWTIQAWVILLTWFSSVPGQAMTVSRPDTVLMMVWYGVLALLHVPTQVYGHWGPVAGWGLAHACLVAACWPQRPAFVMTFLPVGAGSASHVQVPGGGHWLVDAGPSIYMKGEPWDAGELRVVPYLQAAGVSRITGLILTTAANHHAGGVSGVLNGCPTERLFETNGIDNPMMIRTSQAALAAGTRWQHVPEQGWHWASGAAVSVWPGLRRDERQVLGLHWSYGRTSILNPGDADVDGGGTQAFPLADILVLPDHGKSEACPDALLNRVRPCWAVLDGANPTWHRPKPDLRQRLSDHGVRLWDTGTDGPLRLVSDGRRWELQTVKTKVWQTVKTCQGNTGPAMADGKP